MCKIFYKSLILAFAASFLGSCKKDQPTTPSATVPAIKKGVYVICEGQYTVGNGALYLYNIASDSMFGDVFRAVNGGSLGDVVQSMTLVDGHFFLCINNSRKVIVLDTGTLRVVSTILIPFPRYIAGAGNHQAFVSTLYSNKVFVINTETLELKDSIRMPSLNPEGMCSFNGQVFITSWDTSLGCIYRVDAGTRQLIQTIPTDGKATHDIVADKEGMLWVLSGNKEKATQASLTRIDPSTGSILKVYEFPSDAEPIKPVFNHDRDTLYFIGVDYTGGINYNGIFKMGIHDIELPPIPFIKALPLQYFWALGIDPITRNLFVGDPLGFNQKGYIYIFNSSGQKLSQHKVGVGPNSFLFY